MSTLDPHPMFHMLDSELLPFKERGASFDIWEDIPAGRKRIEEALASMMAPYPALNDVPFTDHIAGNGSGAPKVRVYRPEKLQTSAPVLLWLHGGGYIMGSVEMDVGFLQSLAKSVNCIIASVDYRLASENPYPAALDDAYAALKWLHENGGNIGVDSSRVAVGGISGGGGLAAGLCLYARDKGEFPVCYQLLLCPMLDDRNITESSNFPLEGLAWDRRSNKNAWGAYLQRSADANPLAMAVSPYAAAARAKDLSGLPPTYVSVGSVDLFLDENLNYARKLITAGVKASVHVYAGGFHAFECIAAGTELADRSITQIQAALRKAFSI